MATYIDSTYVTAFFGADLFAALWTDSGGNYDANLFNQQVTSASGLVQSWAKTAGYDIGSTTTDEVVKLATLGVLMPMACSRPDKRVALPEGFDKHAAWVAAEDVRAGRARLMSTDPNVTDAVGAWAFTESDPDVDDSLPKRTSKTELSGF